MLICLILIIHIDIYIYLNIVTSSLVNYNNNKMKANQPFQPNKKLILHFDIDGVIRLPARKNKDLYV